MFLSSVSRQGFLDLKKTKKGGIFQRKVKLNVPNPPNFPKKGNLRTIL